MVPFGRVSEWLHKEDERSLGRFEGAVFKRGVVCDAPSSPAHAKGREKERERERAGVRERREIVIIDVVGSVTAESEDAVKRYDAKADGWGEQQKY